MAANSHVSYAERIIQGNERHLVRDSNGYFYQYSEEEKCYTLLDPNKDSGIYSLVLNNLIEAEAEDKHMKRSFISEIISYIRFASTGDHTLKTVNMNDESGKICMNNGMFEFETGVLHKHGPENYTTAKIDVTYDPDAQCPNFDNYLQMTFNGDKKVIENILMIGGYLMSQAPLSKVNKMFIFLGNGSNGKSIFLDILIRLIRGDRRTSLSLKAICGGGGSFSRESLVRSDVNVCSEGKANEFIQGEDELKKIVGGEHITIYRKFLPAVDMLARTKIILLSNNAPKFSDSSFGLSRRMLMVSFNNTYLPEARYNLEMAKNNFSADVMTKKNRYMEDPDLADKLKLEMSGILNRFYKGYELLKERKYKFNETDTESIMRENDPEYTFVIEECEFLDENEVGRWTPLKTFYDDYVAWYKERWGGGSKPVNQNKFIKRVRQLFAADIEKKRPSGGEDGSRPEVYNIIPKSRKSNIEILEDKELPIF